MYAKTQYKRAQYIQVRVYIDFKKAFAEVWLKGLSKLMRDLVGQDMINIIRSLYQNAVTFSGNIGQMFKTTVGVHQVYIPLLAVFKEWLTWRHKYHSKWLTIEMCP